MDVTHQRLSAPKIICVGENSIRLFVDFAKFSYCFFSLLSLSKFEFRLCANVDMSLRPILCLFFLSSILNLMNFVAAKAIYNLQATTILCAHFVIMMANAPSAISLFYTVSDADEKKRIEMNKVNIFHLSKWRLRNCRWKNNGWSTIRVTKRAKVFNFMFRLKNRFAQAAVGKSWWIRNMYEKTIIDK